MLLQEDTTYLSRDRSLMVVTYIYIHKGKPLLSRSCQIQTIFLLNLRPTYEYLIILTNIALITHLFYRYSLGRNNNYDSSLGLVGFMFRNFTFNNCSLLQHEKIGCR